MLCRCVLCVVVFDPKGHRQGCSPGLFEGQGPGITQEETAGNIGCPQIRGNIGEVREKPEPLVPRTGRC